MDLFIDDGVCLDLQKGEGFGLEVWVKGVVKKGMGGVLRRVVRRCE